MEDLRRTRPLAVVTGASSGIGYHLARGGRHLNRMQVIASKVLPAQEVAPMHRKLAEPGSARHDKPDHGDVHPIGPHGEHERKT